MDHFFANLPANHLNTMPNKNFAGHKRLRVYILCVFCRFTIEIWVELLKLDARINLIMACVAVACDGRFGIVRVSRKNSIVQLDSHVNRKFLRHMLTGKFNQYRWTHSFWPHFYSISFSLFLFLSFFLWLYSFT